MSGGSVRWRPKVGRRIDLEVRVVFALFDLDSDKVRTMVLLACLGEAGKEILKDFGIKVGQKVTLTLIDLNLER
jgi:hypothetical protein